MRGCSRSTISPCLLLLLSLCGREIVRGSSSEDYSDETQESSESSQDAMPDSEEVLIPSSVVGTRSASLGEVCSSTEQCQRSVVDSECREETCSCKRDYLQRGHVWCQYAGREANVPSNENSFTCEPESCTEEPCRKVFTRHRELSGFSQVSAPGQVVSPPCEHEAVLKFPSLAHDFGEVITVNYLCAVYVSGNENFTISHIKVQKPPVGAGGHPVVVECTAGRVPCPTLNVTCSGNCSDRAGVTEYVLGNRSDCRPAVELLPLRSGGQYTSRCSLLWILMVCARVFQ